MKKFLKLESNQFKLGHEPNEFQTLFRKIKRY